MNTLVNQARCGDTAAFTEIVKQYQAVISGVLFNVTGDFHKSEDLAQETFLIAWKKLADLKNDDDILPWLCTIARNLANRSFRKQQPITSEIADTQSVTENEPANEMMRREQSEMVWAAVAEIPEAQRETLILFYRSGQSIHDIAAATESTEDAVKQKLYRARQSLKSKLEEMIGDVLTSTAPGEAFTLGVMAAVSVTILTQTAAAAVTAA
jgi:RNA polymerase sigma factor (sigma-70 family)